MSYVQGQPLRADPTQLQVPIIMVAPGNPVSTPNVPVPQGLTPYARYICSMAQIEVESKANQSPIRVHAHNLLAQNGFQNAEFAELLDILLGYINFLMSSQSQFGGDINACITAVVPHVVGAWSAAQVRQYPDLLAYLHPEQQQVARNAVTTMQQIVTEVGRSRQVGYGNPNMGGPGWAAPTAPTLFTQPGYPSANTALGQHVSFSPPQRMVAAPNNLFVNSQRQVMPAIDSSEAIANEQANRSAERMKRQLMEQHGMLPEEPKEAALSDVSSVDSPFKRQLQNQLQSQLEVMKTAAPKVNPPAAIEVLDRVQDSAPAKSWPFPKFSDALKILTPVPALEPEPVPALSFNDWRPSKNQPHHPAWNSSQFRPTYTRHADGSVVCVIVKRLESDSHMDYTAHAIGVQPTQTASFSKDSTGVVMKNKTVEIKNIEYATVDIEFIENDDITVEISDRTPAISAGMLGVMTGDVTEKNQALHTTTYVAEPVLVNTEEEMDYITAQISKASKCNTFDEVWSLMQTMNTPGELALRQRINQVLTRAINNVLTANITSSTYIDDFESDGMGLITIIAKKYPGQISELIAKDQPRLIKATLMALDKDELQQMNEQFKGTLKNPEKWQGFLTFIACKVTHTHLRYLARELDISFPRRKVALLSEEFTPVLHTVAAEIMRLSDKQNVPVARNYIVTDDGLVLMVQRGLLNPQSYLIQVVD